MDSLLYVLPAIGLIVGFIIAYLFQNGRTRALNEQFQVDIQAERDRTIEEANRNKNLSEVVRALEGDRGRLSAQADERARAIGKLEDRLSSFEKTFEAAQYTNQNLKAENERLKAELRAEQDNFEKLQQAREELANQFEAISKRVLSTNSDSFLTLAHQKLGQFQEAAKGDMEKRQQAIDSLLMPLKESLTRLDESNRDMERLRTDAYASLVQQVTQLRQSDELSRQEITKLISTLDSPKPRGDWGEEQLRRIVELAGMTEHCNFDVQVFLKGETSYRADMVIRLAGGKSIIVDAKAPWDRDVFQLDNSKERELKVGILCANFKKHIDDLWKRDYSALMQNSPDFVVMFVPIEPVFHLVLQSDPSLISYAIEKKVVLASPTTLIAMLKSVAYGWQQDAISQNAQKISAIAKELYERFGVFGKHLSSLGKNLNDSVKSYNDLLSSTESRLLVSARRFKDLKVGSATEISDSRPIDNVAMPPTAPELQEDPLLPVSGPNGSLF